MSMQTESLSLSRVTSEGALVTSSSLESRKQNAAEVIHRLKVSNDAYRRKIVQLEKQVELLRDQLRDKDRNTAMMRANSY